MVGTAYIHKYVYVEKKFAVLADAAIVVRNWVREEWRNQGDSISVVVHYSAGGHLVQVCLQVLFSLSEKKHDVFLMNKVRWPI